MTAHPPCTERTKECLLDERTDRRILDERTDFFDERTKERIYKVRISPCSSVAGYFVYSSIRQKTSIRSFVKNPFLCPFVKKRLFVHSSKTRSFVLLSIRLKFFCGKVCTVRDNVVILQPTKPASPEAGRVKTSMEILVPTKPFVGLAKGKGVYERYRLCCQTSQL